MVRSETGSGQNFRIWILMQQKTPGPDSDPTHWYFERSNYVKNMYALSNPQGYRNARISSPLDPPFKLPQK
jgi:hypothetical protein